MLQAPSCMTYAERGWSLWRLTKPRLALLVLFATAAGFAMASPRGIDWERMALALLGTALVSGGAAVLNQALEMRWDGLMIRTRDRPLPKGQVTRPAAFALGAGMTVGGLSTLALGTTLLATCVASLAIVIYIAGYTPMKRRSPVCALVGAVAGAMPPVIGWTAVEGLLKCETVLLFGVLFTWQIPHLLSIAWMHRDDYAGAGFAILRGDDTHGRSAALLAFTGSGLLAGLTFIPIFMDSTGTGYLPGVLLLNSLFIGCTGLFLLERSRESARRLFVVSIVYLPALLTLMIFT